MPLTSRASWWPLSRASRSPGCWHATSRADSRPLPTASRAEPTRRGFARGRLAMGGRLLLVDRGDDLARGPERCAGDDHVELHATDVHVEVADRDRLHTAGVVRAAAS